MESPAQRVHGDPLHAHVVARDADHRPAGDQHHLQPDRRLHPCSTSGLFGASSTHHVAAAPRPIRNSSIHTFAASTQRAGNAGSGVAVCKALANCFRCTAPIVGSALPRSSSAMRCCIGLMSAPLALTGACGASERAHGPTAVRPCGHDQGVRFTREELSRTHGQHPPTAEDHVAGESSNRGLQASASRNGPPSRAGARRRRRFGGT